MYNNFNQLKLFFSTLTHVYEETWHSNSDFNRTFIETVIRGDRHNDFPRRNLAPVRNVQPASAASLHTPDLEAFVRARRSARINNSVLSEKYDADDHQLCCPLLLDFPLIPVRFNGRLYDFDALMALANEGRINDPFTRVEIQLVPHVIQPDYENQARMDQLLVAMREPVAEVKSSQVGRMWVAPSVLSQAEEKEMPDHPVLRPQKSRCRIM